MTATNPPKSPPTRIKAVAVLMTIAAVTLAGCRRNSSAPQPTPGTAPESAQAPGAATDLKEDPNIAVGTFMMSNGRMPTNMQEMVTQKFLRAVPTAPPGKKYVIDPKVGRVVLVPQ